MSFPPIAEIEHADWPSLQRMCETLGLNPKGRSAVVRMRVMDHVRRRIQGASWRPGRDHLAALLTRLGFPDAAQTLWESTIHLDAPTPWLGLGHAELAGGRLGEAAKAFARAAQMGDTSADLHRAEVLAAGGDYTGAVQACDAFLASHPRDLRALMTKASFLSRAGFGDEAIKILRTAVDLHPDMPGPGRTLGVALLKAGHYAAAAELLHEVVGRDSRDIDARVNRGTALLLAGRTREAISVLRESLELDPRHPDALNNLGVAYLAMGRIRSAAVNLERAAKHLESPRILLNLGTVQETEGERANALGTYDQVLRIRPHDPEALAARKRLVPAKSHRAPRKNVRGPQKTETSPRRRARRKTKSSPGK